MIAGLRQQDGKDILIFGSRTLWTALLAQGLVDELHLMVAPIVIGGRTPAFPERQKSLLRLLATEHTPGARSVLLRYAVNRDQFRARPALLP